MRVPYPTPVYRFMHVDNLHVCLPRGGLHAPNYIPEDGRPYKTIHNVEIQDERRTLIQEIGVVNEQMKLHVENVLGRFPRELHRTVRIRPEWYY